MTLRVVVCEDSPVFARELRTFIARDPDLEVVGVRSSAEALLADLASLRPDLITMDLKMPGVGGLAAIVRIMRDQPRPILVISDFAADSEPAVQAIAAGALEAISKTAMHLDAPDDVWATALRSRIKRLASVHMDRKPRGGRIGPTVPPAVSLARPVRAIGIGASTGGPPALATVLGALPADFPIPILVVQHIATSFACDLVSWLDRQLEIPVAFAVEGAPLEPGVWFAPEDAHLGLDRGGHLTLDAHTVNGPHRPSVDMLFGSLARTVRDGAVAVVLTGMGRDGAEGVEAIRDAGGLVVAQDAQSSVVYGMPRAAAEAGADRILALADIGPVLARLRAGVPA
jgi:two-component system chemotaxis response regulator CheB